MCNKITTLDDVRKKPKASVAMEIFLPDEVDALLELLHLAAKHKWKIQIGETE